MVDLNLISPKLEKYKNTVRASLKKDLQKTNPHLTTQEIDIQMRYYESLWISKLTRIPSSEIPEEEDKEVKQTLKSGSQSRRG